MNEIIEKKYKCQRCDVIKEEKEYIKTMKNGSIRILKRCKRCCLIIRNKYKGIEEKPIREKFKNAVDIKQFDEYYGEKK